ncbi:MAG: glycosyltransferase [Candidatus Marinimicrobia bacterium]|jgi:glycosyltransferase involved in cell wall biosynthesis|nr:glycosyltransferase [Candidatus Neomarinimicrobiota bacterium]MBT4177069.1 glycosyltransferase [Candidatus Neomarinimicrobiota bacterium]MBT6159464.1 glycosyltransferase [Candidatus Neomarinimicrobiota bacterium]
MDISIIIPVLDERESLPSLFKELDQNLVQFSKSEVIFIDDGSSDDSSDIIQTQCEKDSKYKLICFFRNFGKSAALAEGFKLASGSYVMTMDADLQDNPAEIPNFIAKLEEGFDLVSGWKKNRHDPWTKRWPSKLANLVTGIMTGVKIHDMNCGIKMYRKKVVKMLDIYGGRHRYIPALAGQRNFKVSEIVVNHRAREYGETKYGGSRLFHGFFDLITILFLNRYVQQPLHLFGFFGLISLALGLIVECVILYFKYGLGESFGSHMALLTFGVMLIVIGIQFFSIGLLGELISGTTQGHENRVKKIINA